MIITTRSSLHNPIFISTVRINDIRINDEYENSIQDIFIDFINTGFYVDSNYSTRMIVGWLRDGEFNKFMANSRKLCYKCGSLLEHTEN